MSAPILDLEGPTTSPARKRKAKASNDLHEHVLADSTTSLKPEAGDTSHLATTAHEPTLDGQLAQEETKGKPAKLTILPMAYDKYLEGYNLSVVKWPAAPKQGDPEDQFMVGCFIRRQGQLPFSAATLVKFIVKIDDIELSNEAFDEHVLKTLHDILQEMITIGESEKLHGISDIIKGKFELALQGTPGVYVPGAKYPGRYPSFWISEEETAAFALEEILTRRDWLKEKATRDDAFHCNITIAEVAEAASS